MSRASSTQFGSKTVRVGKRKPPMDPMADIRIHKEQSARILAQWFPEEFSREVIAARKEWKGWK